ncbi:hypothetical protein ACQW5G_07050 [Fructilactobacillus sp. Tb1]|uniref:hypothetical protein n=1 Tax=Fructilactobacillus sp. Tb1 TaxID=3422304 RepID=UPI003D278A13
MTKSKNVKISNILKDNNDLGLEIDKMHSILNIVINQLVNKLGNDDLYDEINLLKLLHQLSLNMDSLSVTLGVDIQELLGVDVVD